MPDRKAIPNRPLDLNLLFGRIKSPLSLPHPPGTLTVAMIVKNESANIRQVVESFRPIADEFIINDTGSTDGTRDILAALDVQWFGSDWQDDFSLARNQGLERAGSSWILWADADDRLPPDQVENFIKLKRAPLDRIFGFQIINTQAGLPIGSRFMQLRMFPNHPTIRFRSRIHEQMAHSAAELGLHCIYTEATIHHTGYESEELKKSKARRNLAILQGEAERMAGEPALAMSKGDSHFILEEWEKGIEAYKEAMAIPGCEEINRDVFRDLPGCIGRGYQKLSRYDDALDWLDKAISAQPQKLEPLYYKAECLLALGRGGEAAELFSKLVDMPVFHSSTGNQYDGIRMYSFYNLASWHFGEKRYQDAAAMAERMHNHYPNVLESWHLLGKCQVALGREEDAVKSWTHAINLNPRPLEDLHRDLLHLLHRLERKDQYSRQRELALRYFPNIEDPAAESLPRIIRTPQEGVLLSLCMIVKDEKNFLPRCLESVRLGGIADEIVIVDTGSTDGTQDIARAHGARVIQSRWEKDFSLARNQSLNQAQGRWILWLDADDVVPEADGKAIRKLVEEEAARGSKPDRAYGFLVKNSQDGGKTGCVFNQIRLFPNRPDLRFRSPVHEQILPALEEAGIPVEYRPIRILHTGYVNSEISRQKQMRNKEILETQIQNGFSLTPITYFSLAGACQDLGEFERSIEWYRKAAEAALSDGSDPHVVECAPAKIAASLASLGRFTEALRELEQASASAASFPEAVLVRAQVEEALGRHEEARKGFERMLGMQEGNTFIPLDFQLFKIKALQFLGKYWHEKGRQGLAVSLLKRGLEIQSGRDFSLSDLQKAYKDYGLN